jgi:hypothetical protein
MYKERTHRIITFRVNWARFLSPQTITGSVLAIWHASSSAPWIDDHERSGIERQYDAVHGHRVEKSTLGGDYSEQPVAHAMLKKDRIEFSATGT